MHMAYQWPKSSHFLLAYVFLMKHSDDINVTIQIINQSVQSEHEHEMQTAIFDYIINVTIKI